MHSTKSSMIIIWSHASINNVEECGSIYIIAFKIKANGSSPNFSPLFLEHGCWRRRTQLELSYMLQVYFWKRDCESEGKGSAPWWCSTTAVAPVVVLTGLYDVEGEDDDDDGLKKVSDYESDHVVVWKTCETYDDVEWQTECSSHKSKEKSARQSMK